MSVKKIGELVYLRGDWKVKGAELEFRHRSKEGVNEAPFLSDEKAFKEIIAESARKILLLLPSSYREDHRYCLYKSIVYRFDRPGYSGEQKLFQIMELEDRERQKFERLKHKFTLAKNVEKKQTRRNPIPENVRIAVWRRDEGKCAKCGSREKMEYDHIIPLSKGGSDTVRNIELLCEKCNREKCNNIG